MAGLPDHPREIVGPQEDDDYGGGHRSGGFLAPVLVIPVQDVVAYRLIYGYGQRHQSGDSRKRQHGEEIEAPDGGCWSA